MPAPDCDDPASTLPLDGLHIDLPSEQQQTVAHTSPDSPTKTPSSSCSRSSSLSLSRKRSVASMKDLMPLTLSASASSYTSPVLADDVLKDRVNDYLPELLAQDLEVSGDLFAAKRMSAGAPSYSLVADYMTRAKAAGYCANRLSTASLYQPASARVQVLGAIEERDSSAALFEQQEHQQHRHSSGYPDTSDMDDISSEDGSFGMPPPSFRYRRNMSVITSATSFTESAPKHSPQPSPRRLRPTRCSWIDGDSDSGSDMDIDEDEDDDFLPEPLSPLFLASPTSPTMAHHHLNYEQSVSACRSRLVRKKSHLLTGVPPSASSMSETRMSLKPAVAYGSYTTPSNRTSFIAQEFQRATSPSLPAAEQRTPVSHTRPSTPPPVPQKHHRRISKLSEESLSRQNQPLAISAVTARPPALTLESPPMSDAHTSDAEIDEDTPQHDPAASWRGDLDVDYSRTTPPASPPPRHFVTWANAATPYVPNFGGDELARVVPLPPDVVETLRVSVACFPETILLSSSLTIETIRSYSKKMRHPETDLLRLASPATLQDNSSSGNHHSGKRSLWNKVNPLRKASSSSLRHSAVARSASGSRAGSISAAPAAVADAQKAWSAIQNVFGTCSEYICDALFAHIMAYNYVSALLARASLPGRHPSGSGGGGRPSTAATVAADQKRDDIPRKAASLLGLDDGGGGGSRLGRRTSTMTSTLLLARPWSRDGLLPTTAPSAGGSSSSDAPVRTVHEGLYRCIVRLIATARLTSASGRLDEPIVDADATVADALFMRSLCEIVRLVEETS
ncbi:hypothetical protein A9K55_004238 [Cordyceps militaris]|uniref:Uncharacterized protein n=1 Tax=Cordyceps militaris TaxID=73501 RepID=A0A2H4SPU5_CORMI|nr:hypothetical protein A9K55_004238 [Cordyceps militaris]